MLPLNRILPLLGACLLVLSAPRAAASESPAPKIPLGMNLAAPNDYSPGFPFKNLFWGARPWMTRNLIGTGPFDTGLAEKIPLDPQGYPLEVPFRPEGADEQTVFTILPNTVPPGDYVVLYDGEGTLEPAMGSKRVASAPGRLVLRLENRRSQRDYDGPGDYEALAITASKRGNHVRNIRVLALADERADLKTNPFRDDFLAYAKQWHVLRFMDWQTTNNSLEKEWSGRKKPDFYTMVGAGGDAIGRWGKPPSEFRELFSGGVALEIIIQLCNLAQVDPWICVPHRATPEYMTEMARLFRDRLAPERKVYVEYSNEVWNWQFQQANWMLQSKLAGELVTAKGGRAWKNDQLPAFTLDDGAVAKDGGESHPERIGALARHTFEHWERVFEGPQRARLVRVVGVQHSWLDTVRRTARWVVENGGADALSPAGYFGPGKAIYESWEKAGAALTADQVIDDMEKAFEEDSAKWTREIGVVAKQYGLRYVVYEGGQHIQPKDQKPAPYMPALKAAQFHPRMYDLYMKNFALHQEVGCDLFVVFSSIGVQGSRYGSWGHQEYYGQPRSEIPKYRALLDANAPKAVR